MTTPAPASVTCQRCPRRAMFQVVDNEGPDGFACSRHLANVVRGMTAEGWVKVDQLEQSVDAREAGEMS